LVRNLNQKQSSGPTEPPHRKIARCRSAAGEVACRERLSAAPNPIQDQAVGVPYDIYGQRFNPDGTRYGDEFGVSYRNSWRQDTPAVALDATGTICRVEHRRRQRPWHSRHDDRVGRLRTPGPSPELRERSENRSSTKSAKGIKRCRTSPQTPTVTSWWHGRARARKTTTASGTGLPPTVSKEQLGRSGGTLRRRLLHPGLGQSVRPRPGGQLLNHHRESR
jgi:hypothetical protein